MSRWYSMAFLFWSVSFCLCSCAISWRRVPSGAPDAIRSRPYKDRAVGFACVAAPSHGAEFPLVRRTR